jgi:predicted Fe-S protein YdhL (DUF1289 family)
MALFPKIQSPCPYLTDFASIMEGDNCRVCKREVFDLTSMSDAERLSFMTGCKEDVCVSYRLPVRSALAITLAAAALTAPFAAAAQDSPQDEMVVTGGGIRDLANIEYVGGSADTALPDIPVVFEDAAPPQPAAPASKPAAAAKETDHPS